MQPALSFTAATSTSDHKQSTITTICQTRNSLSSLQSSTSNLPVAVRWSSNFLRKARRKSNNPKNSTLQAHLQSSSTTQYCKDDSRKQQLLRRSQHELFGDMRTSVVPICPKMAIETYNCKDTNRSFSRRTSKNPESIDDCT